MKVQEVRSLSKCVLTTEKAENAEKGSRDEGELYGECGKCALRGMQRSHVITGVFPEEQE